MKALRPREKVQPPPSSLLVWVVLSASHKKKPRVRRLKKSRKKILHQNIWFSSCRTSTTILDESNLFCGVSPLCWCFFQGKRGEWGRRWRDLCSMRITRNLERRIRKAIDLCLDVFVYCPSRGIKYVFLVSLCVCVCVYAVCTRRNTFFWLVLEEEERGIICNSVAAAVGRFCCSFWSLYGISHSAVKGKWAGFFNFASSSVFFSPTFGPTEPHKTEKTAFFCSSAIVSGLWLYWASRRVASPLTFYICHPFLLRQSRSFSVVSNGAYGRCSSLIKRCGTSRPVQDGRSAHSYGGGLFF